MVWIDVAGSGLIAGKPTPTKFFCRSGLAREGALKA
jgi:hypothetical protein